VKRLCAFSLLLFACALGAQTTIVTAYTLLGGDGKPLQTGRATFLPADINGNPLNVNVGISGGIMLPRAAVCLISNGAITTALNGGACTVVNTALSNPANFCFRLTIQDTVTKWTAPVMPCVQPSGTTWSLDAYAPPSSATSLVTAGPAGPACSTGSGVCVMSVPVQLPGNPASPLQAAPKQYVDSAVSTASAGMQPAIPNLTVDASGNMSTTKQISAGIVAATASTVTGAGTFGSIATPSATMQNLNGVDTQNYLTAARPPLAQGLFRIKAAAPGSSVGPINIVLFGDSETRCYVGAANCGAGPILPDNRWAEQLRVYLQGLYGSHGTGMRPLITNVTWSAPDPTYYSATGTFTQASLGIGPSQSSSFAAGTGVSQMATGATLTYTDSIPWDHLNIYCATNASSGSMSFKVDGGTSYAATSCNSASGGSTPHVFTSVAYALAVHSVVVTCTAGPCYPYALEGTATNAGVSIHNISVASASAEFFGSSVSTQLAFSDLIPTGTQLVLIDLGTNDVNQSFGYSVTSYTNAMTAIVNHERSLAAPAPSVMLIAPPVNIVATGANWAIYTAALQGVANTLNTAFINIQDRWGTTTSAGYYAQYFYSDQVHPGDFGNMDEYAQIVQPLADAPYALPVAYQANNVNAFTYSDRPGNALLNAQCNNYIQGYALTSPYCVSGTNMVSPGTNSYTLGVFGSGGPNANVVGQIDNTTSKWVWNSDGSDGFCLGTPDSGTVGNVLSCIGSGFHYNPITLSLGLNALIVNFSQTGTNGNPYVIRQQVSVTGTLCTTAAPSGSSCNYTVTFPKAFPNTSWHMMCYLITSTGVGILGAQASTTTTSALMVFTNMTSVANTLGGVNCEGFE